MSTISSSSESDYGKFQSIDPKIQEQNRQLGNQEQKIGANAKKILGSQEVDAPNSKFAMPTITKSTRTSNRTSDSTDTTTSKTDQLFQRIVHGDKEIQKGKSEEGQKHLMLSLFHLNTVPDTPDKSIQVRPNRIIQPEEMKNTLKENNVQKKELMAKHLQLNKASNISAQARKYPIMQAAIEGIRQNLEKWDDLVLSNDEVGLDNLKGKLEQQMKNLAAFSGIISDATQNPDHARALATLVPNPAPFEELVQSYVKGSEDLTKPKAIAFVGQGLKENLSQLQAKLPKPATTAELAERRGKAPVTTKAIQLQAELHHAIRKGKGWAASQTIIKRHGKSMNEVFKLLNPVPSPKDKGKFPAFEATPGKPAAFLKVGKGGEEAAGVMEKMIWDIAVVMGLEEQFVATGVTEVRTSEQLIGEEMEQRVAGDAGKSKKGKEMSFEALREDWSAKKLKKNEGKEKVAQWTGDAELIEVKGKRVKDARRKGGIQVAQKGVLFKDYLKNPGAVKNISRRELTKATLTSVVFGMFDAHQNNIFVTEDGKIKFFDNTRSLPNSNGYINRGSGIFKGSNIVSSYRCSLLNLLEAREKLNITELKQLKQDVAENKEKIGRLKKYLNSPQAQAQLKKLPPGWMDLKSSIAALEERVNLMEAALNSGKVESLQDLVEASNPVYKFAIALTFLKFREIVFKGKELMNCLPKTVQEIVHTAVGKPNLGIEVINLTKQGYDVKKIKEWCDNPNLTMNDIIKNLQDHNIEVKLNPPSYSEYLKRTEAAKHIGLQMIINAAFDYKDKERKRCGNYYVKKTKLRKLRKNHQVVVKNYDKVFNQMGILKFKKKGVKKRVNIISEALNNASNKSNHIELVEDAGKYKVIYNTYTGYRVKEIDIKSSQGKVKIAGKEMPIKDFIDSLIIDSLKGIKDPPTFDELPVLSTETTKNHCNFSKEGIILRKSSDNKSLVVALIQLDSKGNTEIFQYKFAPGQDGKFVVNLVGMKFIGEFTIGDIFKKLANYAKKR